MTLANVSFRKPTSADLNDLVALEQACFSADRLSRRSFSYWLKNPNCVFLLAVSDKELLGYALTIIHRGTRLARLYSIAVKPSARGHRLAEQLLSRSEQSACDLGRIYMRLEVSTSNRAAIQIYEKLGYKTFGIYQNYYEDHADAMRMQKCIRKHPDADTNASHYKIPWYEQTTDFTCGPAALIMAMAGLDSRIKPSQLLELSIWRQATTIYMTSGHGGSHPLGLALAARHQGFESEVILNSHAPLFVEGVRNPEKKHIIEVVDREFRKQAKRDGVKVRHKELEQKHIVRWLHEGYAVIVLISTNRLNGKKAPHWVTVTSLDDVCIYVHDPDIEDGEQDAFDCQHIPIARDEFAKMAAFGSSKLRTAVAIRKSIAPKQTLVNAEATLPLSAL